MYFDCNLGFFHKYNSLFDEIIDKMQTVILKYSEIIKEKSINIFDDIELDLKSAISFLSYEYHMSNIEDYQQIILTTLKNKKFSKINKNVFYVPPNKSKELYCYNDLKSLLPNYNELSLFEYCSEKEHKTNKAFNSNIKVIKDFLNNTDLAKDKLYSISSIGIDLEIYNLLDLKLLYFSLVENGADCNLTRRKYDSYTNVSTLTIMGCANDYITNMNFDINKEVEYDKKNYNIMDNEKNNVLLKNTFLLTEKIRYSFYREYEKQQEYLRIIELQSNF